MSEAIGRVAGATATIDLDLLSFRRLRVLGTTFSTRSDDERAAVAAALATDVLPRSPTDGSPP